MLATDWEWCWADPVCVSVAASVCGGLAEFARRLNPNNGERVPQDWGGFTRYLFSGTVTASLAAGALCVGWYQFLPSKLLLGFTVTLLGGVAVGWGSDEGLAVVKRLWKKIVDRVLPEDPLDKPNRT